MNAVNSQIVPVDVRQQSYNAGAKKDNLQIANGMLNDVKKSVANNIGKALRREDDLKHVARVTEHLSDRSKGFSYEGRQLRNDMWWNRAKTSGVMIFLTGVRVVTS